MSLTFGITTTKELQDKLKRDAASLNEEVTSDAFFNFVVTGYSLIDWVKNDPTVPASAKTQTEIASLYGDSWLKVCGDLAIAAKHYKFTKRVPVTASATSDTGFGMGRYGKGGFGIGEESINITLNDGTSFPGLDFVQGVLHSWERFFTKHSI